MPVRNEPIAWPPVLQLSLTAHPNNFTLNSALPWVLSNTPAKCEVDWINDCRIIEGQTALRVPLTPLE